ncbi:MAG TPA: hypothetical protein VF077_10970 [Nitrospiraceae bacterium]
MVDAVVDAKPMEKLPYDPAVIPEAVKRRAAAVDALYKPAEPANSNGSTPEQLQFPLDAPVTQAPTTPPSQSAPAAPTASAEDGDTDWKRKFLRMQGQYNASQKTIGEMQEQMTQLGNELLQTQNLISRQPSHQTAPPPPAPSYLTQEDVQNYGTDLVDFAQRAAVHAVAPHLQSIEQQNAELQRQLGVERRRRLDQAVELAVPNYREIDRNPDWHRWLLGIDVLSGRVRQTLLDEAIAAAQAPRVISFFRGFLQEATTGHNGSVSHSLQANAPRDAAIPLASLAAPGRARPATGGDASVPPDRPMYTRALIKQLYEQHRKGAYAGREAEWNRQEADIIAAGREGRVR